MTTITALDEKVDHLADKLTEFAHRSADDGGLIAKFAGPLEDEADFLRKLKPSLIKARIEARKSRARSSAPHVNGDTPHNPGTQGATERQDVEPHEVGVPPGATQDVGAPQDVSAAQDVDTPQEPPSAPSSLHSHVDAFRERLRGSSQSTPNPWVVVGVCFAAGVVAARLIDWRGRGD